MDFYRMGVVDDWKIYFVEQLTGVIKQVAGGLLVDLGYKTEQNW